MQLILAKRWLTIGNLCRWRPVSAVDESSTGCGANNCLGSVDTLRIVQLLETKFMINGREPSPITHHPSALETIPSMGNLPTGRLRVCSLGVLNIGC